MNNGISKCGLNRTHAPKVIEMPPTAFQLLPAPAGTCEQCAVAHDPRQAHNQQSLHYQYWFFQRNGRWPTWADAIAHCTPEIQAFWRKELGRLGVEVPEPEAVKP